MCLRYCPLSFSLEFQFGLTYGWKSEKGIKAIVVVAFDVGGQLAESVQHVAVATSPHAGLDEFAAIREQ